MDDFEKLKEEVEQEINEEDLYGEGIQEEEPPSIDLLENLKLEDALYFIGLAGARLRKAKNPHVFASIYASSMSQWLKMIGFEWALKQTVKEVRLNPKVILIIGGISIVFGIFIVPAGGESFELAGGGKVRLGEELFRKTPGEQTE